MLAQQAGPLAKTRVAPRQNDVDDPEYGDDLYCYMDGQRYCVGRVRTLHPHDGDTNADFEQRMHLVAERLYLMKAVASVSMTFKRQAGAYTECVLHMVFPPRLAPIVPDPRPAGGRFSPRGGRGGR